MKACVDIGGTKVAVSLAYAATEGARALPTDALRHRRVEATATTGTPDAVALQILRMLGQACDDAGARLTDIEAVGVSSCGPFVLKAGMIELAAPNICGGLAGPARGLPNDWTSAALEAHCGRSSPMCGSKTMALPRCRPNAAGVRCRGSIIAPT